MGLAGWKFLGGRSPVWVPFTYPSGSTPSGIEHVLCWIGSEWTFLSQCCCWCCVHFTCALFLLSLWMEGTPFSGMPILQCRAESHICREAVFHTNSPHWAFSSELLPHLQPGPQSSAFRDVLTHLTLEWKVESALGRGHYIWESPIYNPLASRFHEDRDLVCLVHHCVPSILPYRIIAQ